MVSGKEKIQKSMLPCTIYHSCHRVSSDHHFIIHSKNVSSYFQLPSCELSYPCPYRHFRVDDVPFPKVGYVSIPCQVYIPKKTHTTSHRDSEMFRPGWLTVVSIVLKFKPCQLVEKKDPITWKSYRKKRTLPVFQNEWFCCRYTSGYLILFKGNLQGGIYGPQLPKLLTITIFTIIFHQLW